LSFNQSLCLVFLSRPEDLWSHPIGYAQGCCPYDRSWLPGRKYSISWEAKLLSMPLFLT
jgi:hypothetical protein